MSESILRNLKTFGLTPWKLVLGAAVAYGWFTSLMPMPAEMRTLNATVQSLGTKVEIHTVLISQISDLKTEVTGMRRELSTIEGRLAHTSNYKTRENP